MYIYIKRNLTISHDFYLIMLCIRLEHSSMNNVIIYKSITYIVNNVQRTAGLQNIMFTQYFLHIYVIQDCKII